jgi:hypothetical protein
VPAALDLIERAIGQGDLRAAVAVLRSTGLDHLSAPQGPTDAREIEAADAKAEFKPASRLATSRRQRLEALVLKSLK